MHADVKDILYSVIDDIGREKIRTDITTNVDMCEKYCRDIINKCTSRLGQTDDETLSTLCEALLHFMLTASVLPSERKVSSQGADLDVVIPSLKMLDQSPDKALVIQVIKRREDLAAKARQAESVQTRQENIWFISAKKLEIDRRSYHLGSGDCPYSRIIPDINTFLVEKGNRGLRLLY